ncbi:MAG: FeoB-associated Cys-rich membrane protein [Clostridiales bacterium]|nr:FeoB-associated Cys-rich membrane protein [Clostridiales bacterium]
MIDLILNNIGNIVAIAIVLLIVFLAIWSLVKDKREGKSSCGCDCANCGVCHCKASSADAPCAKCSSSTKANRPVRSSKHKPLSPSGRS